MIITGNGHKAAVGKPGEMISGQAEAISNPPHPHADPLPLVRPGGAVSSSSRFYVHRQADDDTTRELEQERGMVTIRGPRQTGKTSLLLYIHVHFKRKNEIVRSVFVDFQSFTTDLFNDMNSIWKKIADEIVYQLFIDQWQASMWQMDENYDRNMCRL